MKYLKEFSIFSEMPSDNPNDSHYYHALRKVLGKAYSDDNIRALKLPYMFHESIFPKFLEMIKEEFEEKTGDKMTLTKDYNQGEVFFVETDGTDFKDDNNEYEVHLILENLAAEYDNDVRQNGFAAAQEGVEIFSGLTLQEFIVKYNQYKERGW